MAEEENKVSPDMNLSDYSKQENKLADNNDDETEVSPKDNEEKNLEHDRDALNEVPITIKAVVGERSMPVRELLKLERGAVVSLDRKLGSPIDIYANDRLIARGEITIVEDDNIAVTMTEIMVVNKPR